MYGPELERHGGTHNVSGKENPFCSSVVLKTMRQFRENNCMMQDQILREGRDSKSLFPSSTLLPCALADSLARELGKGGISL